MLEQYPDVLKTKDIMSILGIGKDTVYQLLKKQEIKCFRVGITYLIPKESMIEFLQAPLKSKRRS